MIKYARILLAVANEPWAMQPEKLGAMMDIIRFAAEGGKLPRAQIDANLADARGELARHGVSDEIQMLDIDGKRLSPSRDRATAKSHGAVAVISLSGVISNRAPLVEDVSTDPGTSVERFSSKFRAVMNDEQVKAVIIDTNSPGGTVSGVPEMAEEIFQARNPDKPIVAHVNSLNASAAYYITSAADEIVAAPSAQVGSIGVYTLHEDVSKMFEEAGIKETLISAGKFKVEGNPFEPLGEEARAHIQSVVDDYYGMFVDAVARHRGVSSADVRNGYGQGRTLTAQRALKAGLVDRIATLDETLARFGVGPTAERRPTEEPRGMSRAHAAREIDLINL